LVLSWKLLAEGLRDRFDDSKMETIMGRLLQIGVLSASLVMLAGGILYMRAHNTLPNYRVFQSQPEALRHIGGVVKGVARGDSEAVIELAVLLLIATPVARVVFALIAFGIERDKLYIAVSAVVLAVLLFGFFRSQ
jgi:uncharacterized membrane protein